MASRKETEKQAKEAGLSDEEISGASTIADLEAAIAGHQRADSDNLADNPDYKAGGGPQTGIGTQQAPGVPTTPATIIPPAPTEDELRGKSGGKIERMTAVAWWCPNCDNANERSLNSCGKCGAKVSKDGQSVGKAERV